jgi:anti-anti-sigma factor
MNQAEGTGEILLIRLSEWKTHESFADRIDHVIESGIIRIVLDLHQVAIVNSTMLGLFVKTRNAVKARGGDFVLVEPSEFISKTLEVLGLMELFTVVAECDTAVKHFWPPD